MFYLYYRVDRLEIRISIIVVGEINAINRPQVHIEGIT